ncbi:MULTISPECIES: alpha/beta fold hydrolase [Bosea]|nr:alpha/beta hydrolase [Bosea vaviloviae]
MSLPEAAAAPAAVTAVKVLSKTVKVNGLDIAYREAGPKDGPVVLLLHGFPSSSHMFRNLIPQLASTYRVIAPDYPGFGDSSAPSLREFPYTFAALADIVDGFTDAVGAKSYVVFMQDYGGPIGFRLAIKHPDKVKALIIQNAVANVEGWNPDVVKQFAPFWQKRNSETEAPVRAMLKPETTKFQYVHGSTRAERLSPDAWTHDQANLDRPGNAELQVEMLFNYQDNVAQYPAWQEYLKQKQPKTLIVWGKNDPFFRLEGVEFFMAQLPKAEVHLYDAGHFALETHLDEIASASLDFLNRLPKGN